MSYHEWNTFLSQCSADEPKSAENTATDLFDLTELGIISIAGKDAEKLLQGQLTTDVQAINSHQYRLSAFCNPKGRILSLFALLKTNQTENTEFLALLPRDIIDTTIEALKKYAVFFQVAIEDHSQHWGVFGLSESPISNENPSPFQIQPWLNGYLLHWPAAQHYAAILPTQKAIDYCQSIRSVSYQPYQKWQLAEIKAGMARIYPETLGQLLPHYLDLPALQAVNFEKGCYTGQEVIARMHYKGKLKSHLYYLSGDCDTSNPPSAQLNSDLVADDKKIGTVISAITADSQIHILAVCQDLVLSATKIQCNQENGPILQVNEFSNRTFDAET